MENDNQIQIDARKLGVATFIDLRLDYAFKLIFGTPGNEDLLLNLINAILPERNFKSVKLSTNERVGLRPTSRKAVFDVFATTPDGSDVTIEMQYKEQDDFSQRMFFYSTFPTQNHILKGFKKEDGTPRLYYSFPHIYVIGITDFVLDGDPGTTDIINYYSIRNEKRLDKTLTDKVSLITVELPKLNKTIEELATPADYMFYAIRNIGSMSEMPDEYRGKGLEKLFELCRFAKMSENEQRQYLAELMAQMDEGSRMQTAVSKGERIGRTEVARTMLAKGLEKGMVSEYTGLSIEDVERIQ